MNFRRIKYQIPNSLLGRINNCKFCCECRQTLTKVNFSQEIIKEIEETIVDLAATGVDVMITELDITVIPNPYELAGIAREEFKKFEKFL